MEGGDAEEKLQGRGKVWRRGRPSKQQHRASCACPASPLPASPPPPPRRPPANLRRHKPPAQVVMRAGKVLSAELGGGEGDEHVGAQAGAGGVASLHVPPGMQGWVGGWGGVWKVGKGAGWQVVGEMQGGCTAVDRRDGRGVHSCRQEGACSARNPHPGCTDPLGMSTATIGGGLAPGLSICGGKGRVPVSRQGLESDKGGAERFGGCQSGCMHCPCGGDAQQRWRAPAHANWHLHTHKCTHQRWRTHSHRLLRQTAGGAPP